MTDLHLLAQIYLWLLSQKEVIPQELAKELERFIIEFKEKEGLSDD